jgi:hypothetical protein
MVAPILPNREKALKEGWTHQVQWTEEGNPCYIRCKSETEAELVADKLGSRLSPFIIDLVEAMKVH